MRILISITDLRIGGAQTFAIRLAQGLSEQHQVYLYNYELSTPAPEDTVINQLSPKFQMINFPSGLSSLAGKAGSALTKLGQKNTLWRQAKAQHFRWAIAQHQIQVVNTHLFHSDQFVTQTLKEKSLPIVISDHGDYRYAQPDDITPIFQRAEAIVYPSESNGLVAAPYSKAAQIHETKIYYGLPTPQLPDPPQAARQQLGIPESAFVFGLVARGIPSKGWAEAIAAFEKLRANCAAETYLILVGASNFLDQLKQSLAPELKPYVHFTGFSSDPPFWIDSFDVGLLPTYFPGESLPNTVIEYLGMHKPVIATRQGGITEMITHGENIAGHLLPLNEAGQVDIEPLYQAMRDSVEEPEQLKQQQQLAQEAFEKFALPNCVARYEALFEQLIQAKSPQLHRPVSPF